MKKIIAVSACLALFAAFIIADDIDVSGPWKLTSKTPRGERNQTIVIEQDGSKITVSSENRQGEKMTGTGTISGTAINWTITRETPRGKFELSYSGTVDGDTMSGTVTMGDRGASDWTAKRTELKEKKEPKEAKEPKEPKKDK